MSRALLVGIVLALSACSPRKVELHYQSGKVLNARTTSTTQPVLVGLYPLKYVPSELADAPCESFERPDQVAALVADAAAGALPPISVTPQTAHERFAFDRPSGARWLVVVPFYEGKCRAGEDVDLWAVVRMLPPRKRLWLVLDGYEIALPDGPRSADMVGRWKQRGCVDHVRSRVLWPWC